MGKHTFCTIITGDYFYYALTLYDSLTKFKKDINFNVLVSNSYDSKNPLDIHVTKGNYPNLYLHYAPEICQHGIKKAIYQKYATKNINHFRWSMKGAYMTYLLEDKDYQRVIYVDPDVYFFNNYHFLFEELNENSLLLTPHWRCAINPQLDVKSFDRLFTQGLFNAGFIGANQSGIPALKQLATWCLYKCINDPTKGILDDQTYLNLLPVYFEGVKILKHRGCNLAEWNLIECNREKEENIVKINGQYEIIFIHFTMESISRIQRKIDPLLKPYLDMYLANLKEHQPNINFHNYNQVNNDKREVHKLKEKIKDQNQIIFEQKQELLSTKKQLDLKRKNLIFYVSEVKKQENLFFLLKKIGNWLYNKVIKD